VNVRTKLEAVRHRRRRTDRRHAIAPFRSYGTFYVLLTPPLFNPNFWDVSVVSDRPLGVNERMGLKLFGREIIFEEFQPI